MRRALAVSALLALLALAGGGSASSASAAASPHSAATVGVRPPAWVQREALWQSLAAGEPRPVACSWLLTSPARAARLAGKATSYLRSFPSLGRVFVVVLRGRFGASDAQGMRSDRLYLVLRVQGHGYLAQGLTSARRLDLAALAPLHRYVPRLSPHSGVWGHTMAEGGPFPGGPWPLAHVAVAVWQGANAPATGQPLRQVRSDWAGFFSLELTPGIYTFRVTVTNQGWQAPTTVTVKASTPVAAGVYTIRP